jgi:hypothetical protein
MHWGLTATALLISRKGEVEGQPFANMILHYITVVHRTINTAFYTYEACSKHFRDFITEHFIFYLWFNCPCYTYTPTTNRLLQMFPLPIHRSNFFLQFSTQSSHVVSVQPSRPSANFISCMVSDLHPLKVDFHSENRKISEGAKVGL